MKESILRETIRKEIRKSLKEQDVTTGVERETGKIERQPGVKMLKRALGQGSPQCPLGLGSKRRLPPKSSPG